MVIIVIPLAAVSLILATTTYRSVTKGIRANQIAISSNFAARSRIWYRGSLHTLTGTVSSVIAAGSSEEACRRAAAKLIETIQGYEAVGIRIAKGVTCRAARNLGHVDELEAEVLRFSDGDSFTPTQTEAGPLKAHYDARWIAGRRSLVVEVQHQSGDSNWEAMLIADPVMLDRAFEVGMIERGTVVGLVDNHGRVIVSRGAEESDESWLPEEGHLPLGLPHWQATGRDGTTATYSSETVAPNALHVVTRFSGDALQAARAQFLVLCLSPLLMMVLLLITYARAIQNNVIHWISGIETAARGRNENVGEMSLAPVKDTMPQDIRRVAEAFNDMVSDSRRREQALSELLAANHMLNRELHHRVKNSLQVIQSYLALARRHQRGQRRAVFAEVEARVQVLSVAYRTALTDNGLRPVSVNAFAREILSNVTPILPSGKRLVTELTADVGLIVDRAIPFGLALVEAVLAGIDGEGTSEVRVMLTTLENGVVELAISTNGSAASASIWPKIASGLAAQLDAEICPLAAGQILRWRFMA